MRVYIEKATESLEMVPPDYKRAMVHLLNAIDECQFCTNKGRHGKDKECHIRQCTRIVRSKSPDEMRNIVGRCSCGFVWPQCSSPDHIDALDLLADAQQQGEQWISSLATAMGLIRLDPTCAAGYCRVAKIISGLEKANRLTQDLGPADSKIAKTVAALLKYFDIPQPKLLVAVSKKFVQAGLRQSTDQKTNLETPRHTTINYARVLQLMGHRLGLPESKRDPAKVLPLELYQSIFQHLDSTARSRCLRVNRNWHDLVMKSNNLWACLAIPRPAQISDSALASFLNKHPHIETLIFRDSRDFGPMSPKKLSSIQLIPSLRRLILPNSKFAPECTLRQAKLPSKLEITQLCLGNVTFDLLYWTLSAAEKTLQVLQLPRCSAPLDMIMARLSMPNLRSLALTGEAWGTSNSTCRTPIFPLSIVPLAGAAPNLQELFIDCCRLRRYDIGAEAQDPTHDISEYWRSLRAITLGPRVLLDASPAALELVPRCFPPPTESMEKIDIMTTDPAVAHNYLFTVEVGNDSEHPVLHGEQFRGVLPAMPNLHTFRCRVAIEAPLLQQILELPASNLRVLELAILPGAGLRPRQFVYRPDIPATGVGRPDEVLAWLRCENLEHVGLHDFNFCTDMSTMVGPRFDGESFTNWIETNFPKVDSVAVYPGAQPDCDTYIGGLISHHRKFRVIWQDSLRGINLDHARELARRVGVELRHWPKHVPAGPDTENVTKNDCWDVSFNSLWEI
ncbi:hypothetical protein QBC44DRAFT_381698 [Cladorrhinum sp. PSN332]|nr:hypothetical protein QBC44DRAFT_381698 [Cladorrhinum sp. PSN332]